MRPLYLLLRIFLPYALIVFYRRKRTINGQKRFNAQTIFVSNHPSAFIDPLVAASFQMPVVYFVTRGDIFTKWLHPVTWASHMVPIFRKAQDGADSHEKNKDSFRYLRDVLKRKKSLIMFGEGYTDDVFIRSLKPIKKGPARIAFDTMVETDWTLDIKMQAIGINYTHPKHFRSDVLVSMSNCLYIKDYKELYLENPTKAITQLTRDIQEKLQQQITYVGEKDLAPFVENLLILSRKGMNNFHRDPNTPLISRYNYSKSVATRVNEEFSEDSEEWMTLKTNSENYFEKLKKENINENWVVKYSKQQTKGTLKNALFLLLGLPIAVLGFIHNFIPYFLIKRFVEKSFKRDVFWSGVKMMLGWIAAALFNIPVIFLFHAYVADSYLLAILYYLTVPAISWTIAYHWAKLFKNTKALSKIEDSKLEALSKERGQLTALMEKMNLN